MIGCLQEVRLERYESRGGVARVTGYADFDSPAHAEQAMNLVKVRIWLALLPGCTTCG